MKKITKNNWSFFSVDRFNDFIEDWNRLNQLGENSPVLDALFIQVALKYFSNGTEILAVLKVDDDVLAIVILVRDKSISWSTFQPSQLPLGALIFNPDYQINDLLPSLIEKMSKRVLVLGLTQQDPHIYDRPSNRCNVITLDYIETARILVNTNFDKYWSNRGKNLKRNIIRQNNRLEREGVVRKIAIEGDLDSVDNSIKEYGQLEKKSWKADGGTAIEYNNVQGKFYRELMYGLCKNNKGVIYKYYYNDKVVAIDLCAYSESETIVILKTTYDSDQKNTSPTMLMRYEVFSKIFSDREYKKIEFYGRVMDWHKRWSDDIRMLYHINYYRWDFLPKVISFMKAIKNLKR